MVAVEFETYAKNGIIKIPEKYREFMDGELKIIMLKQDEIAGSARNNKMADIKKSLKQIRERNIFQRIDSPEEWQETLRNEWS
ncbi:MAG: hypothetical protein GTO45_09385 [Candidatus Aminicenantes bacterium]|nr:hypothetical protein [Candidatus Aminicenantes bacterium]NIM79026.1 hypothetical protein [Candidatus Aminicenantes bacterium]NIN18305.1 hypothetical protein [Candidatus Aminicenantes bacterium]NIN42192.1 hypothetical protein [Candidatus Aminicenantes bacterium]NIN84958.1 hypothetical protein [Candidatus Aminicenantes bacterium]